MPYEVDPTYIKIVKKKFLEKFGSPTFLDHWDISYIINGNLLNGDLPREDELDTILDAMAEKAKDKLERTEARLKA